MDAMKSFMDTEIDMQESNLGFAPRKQATQEATIETNLKKILKFYKLDQLGN